MDKGKNGSTSSTGSSESGTPSTNGPVYRVIRPARVMNVSRSVSRPVSQTAVKKNIASAVFWEKKV